MWALVENNSITTTYARPTAITVGDVNYPANIMSIWTASELEAIGIYEVVKDGTNRRDGKYYLNGVETIAFASGVVTQSYGVATAKSLTNVLWTAEEDKPPAFSTGDVKTRGIKEEHKASVNHTAEGLLNPYDWYTLRAASGGTAVPSAVATYKTAIRTKSNEMCTLIDNAANVDALAALYVFNDDDPPVQPIGVWPTLEE